MANATTGMVSPQSLQNAIRSRLNAVRSRMNDDGLDALLITNPVDIDYLTGFIGHDSWLVVTAEGGAVISDSRYDEHLNPIRENGPVDVIMGVRHRLHLALRDLCAEASVKTLGVQAEHLTVAALRTIADALSKKVTVTETTGVVGALRRRKDGLEIEAIAEAIRINEEALSATLPQIGLGMSEREISAMLEYEMKRRGGAGAGFTPIIAVGPHGSLPHYETTDAILEGDTSLLIDWGTTVGGYQSDLTRTFGINEMPPKIREIYSVVLEAQQAAIDAIAPGRICADIDRIAREVITRAGYGEYFAHGLGHGMGKNVHEPPFFNNLETATELEPGHVMTVEPGIYLPGVGGVRIEDDIVVTDSGCRVLSSFPKRLEDAVISVT